jgi:hypothetical protein
LPRPADGVFTPPRKRGQIDRRPHGRPGPDAVTPRCTRQAHRGSGSRWACQEIGKKPFKSATPNNSPSIVDRRLCLEVGTNLNIKNLSYWPSRKEGRVWVTWVSHAFLYSNYRGSLPAGFDWLMDDAALRARFNSSVPGVLRAPFCAAVATRRAQGNGRIGLRRAAQSSLRCRHPRARLCDDRSRQQRRARYRARFVCWLVCDQRHFARGTVGG